ncbi:glutamine amidotransferase [Acinetobacter rathckeae]|uniref:glutamine amidotransferase n=1 Tax=Acinetobacter rathckeae TaxID=2605272 RepID=UPI0018A2E3EF|nr:glutamine amidotransferase [Acinetobacter rathckeae]MBF7687545.1 glutamine amidotransferase [Acinetobacter rathckeae]MBF7694947.1 glutamine amidotransferase [Acinetobacter rathckeae]
MHCSHPTIYAIKHVSFEDLGSLEDVFYEHGYRIRYFDAGVDSLDTALNHEGLTVILGGPIGVNDISSFPFLKHELALLKLRLIHNKPTLGICLGAQLMAKALGASVYAGEHKEIGWGQLQLSDANNILSPLADIPVLHWHGDTFDLPKKAKLLASSAYYPHQAFQLGHSLALQFHLEIDAQYIEQWLIGHHHELSHHQIDIEKIRDDSEKYGDLVKTAAKQVITQYLQHIHHTL